MPARVPKPLPLQQSMSAIRSSRVIVSAVLVGLLAMAAFCFRVGSGSAGHAGGSSESARRMYASLKRDDGSEVAAFLGPERVALGSAAAACAGCHGKQGQGSREGAIEAPALAGTALTVWRNNGLSDDRPAYLADTFLRAVNEGVSASGRPLNWAMPRFDLSREESATLYTLLTGAQLQLQRGVSASAIRLAAPLPLSGSQARMGRAARSVLQSYFEEVNATAGLYGRQVLIEFADSTADDGQRSQWFQSLVQADILCIVGGFNALGEASEAHLAAADVLWVGAWGLEEKEVSAPHIFSLFPSREALKASSHAPVGDGVFASDPSADALASPETQQAFANWIDDETTPNFSKYLQFGTRHRLDNETLRLGVFAYAAAQMVTEALKRAGAQPTTQSIQTALEGFSQFETDVTAPMSFGPSRRVGSLGFFLVQMESTGLRRTSQFVSIRSTSQGGDRTATQ